MPISIKNKLLIISDGKPGHLNQSIAFAKLMDYEYDILEISFKKKWFKSLSYILSKLNIFTFRLFDYKKSVLNHMTQYQLVVGAGSSTYYFIQTITNKYFLKSVVMMLPKGYDYSKFDYIFAQEHDNPPNKKNIIKLPVNMSVNEPKGYIKKSDQKSVGIIIGGDNNIFFMQEQNIKNILDEIFTKYKDYKKYITTSRRTPLEIEQLIDNYEFDYKLIYSKDPNINPIPDFIEICDELFITIDSTSMLSEARANSDAKIHIIDLDCTKQDTKFHKIANIIKNIDHKIDFQPYLDTIKL
jgi:mitochondrial fission protein ELM1